MDRPEPNPYIWRALYQNIILEYLISPNTNYQEDEKELVYMHKQIFIIFGQYKTNIPTNAKIFSPFSQSSNISMPCPSV